MLKKVSFILIFLSSSSVFAGIMGVCQPESVTVPCDDSGFDISGRALYMQPTNHSHGQVNYFNGSNNRSFGLGANPSWGWGFELDASVHFDAGNDLNVDWFHFRNENTQTIYGPYNYSNIIVTQPYVFDPTYFNTLTINSASTNINPQWDQINIEFAKRVNYGRSDFSRLHGGFNFSRVANSGSSSFNGLGNINGINYIYANSEVANTSYNGFGMRTGFDLNHDWGNGLMMYANLAASLMTGTAKSSYTFYDNLTNGYYSGIESTSIAKVVPELDGRLGLNYTYAMVQGDLTVDMGWLWVNYFNVLTIHENNFGLQGLFFGLKWHGNFI